MNLAIRVPDSKSVRDVRDRIADRLPLDRLQAALPFKRPPPPSKLARALPLLGAAAAGAVVEFLLDPDRGRGRRAKARDMVAGRLRRTARDVERKRRFVASKAYGIRQKAAHGLAAPAPEQDLDDVTLADKVMSEVLGAREFSDARILVNAENGIVVLRGEVDNPEQFRRLEKEVAEMPGVAGVKNMLHLKGSTPVNKLASVEASRRASR